MIQTLKFIQKYRFYFILLIAVIGIVFVISVIDSRSNEAATYNDGYTEISSVPGVVFDVPKSYSDSAQAVLEISKKVDFLDNQTYSFKNGKDMYLLFNIKKVIVIVKKGTNFNLADGTDVLKKRTLNGIWFTPTDSVQKGNGKIEVNVSAEVIITNNIYNDFNGKLCTLNDGTNEYSLFVGTNDEEVIKHVCESFKLSKINAEEIKDFSIDIETSEMTEIVSEPIVPIKPIEEPILEPIDKPIDKPVTEPITEKYDDETVSDNEQSKEPASDTEDNFVEAYAEPNEEPIIIEPVVIEPKKVEPENPHSEEKPQKEGFSIENNQKEIQKEEGKAYSSNIYSMLKIGDTGFAMTKNGRGKYETTYIKATEVLKSESVQALIDKYIASGKSYYSEFEVPKGMHLEAVKYDIKSESDTSYLNILLKGVDGETLKHNGVIYSSRTHDILQEAKGDEWVCDNVVFYLVPNGCTEYVLQFGEGENEEKCFYHIIQR